MHNKEVGTLGEKELTALAPCPNCSKKLMLLPVNYPLYDVQCVGCSFRAQVKTVNSKPKSVRFGAGWEIISKVLKSGFIIPPLFVNFKWQERGKKRQEIRFYPFIPKRTLQHYKLSAKAHRANYKMFVYSELDKLPYFLIYNK